MVRAPKSLLDDLGEHPVLVVDTAPIIYWLEGHPRLADRFAPVFEAAESGAAQVVISTVTLAEVLAGPLRVGNELLTAQYREALTRSAGWQVLPFDAELAVEAARVRAVYRLRLPDAIQVATAIRAGAAALVTHDRALRRVRGLRVLGPE
jgi:predicted nucleic acid-binding protein